MATGVSKTKWNGGSLPYVVAPSDMGVWLTYEGKDTEDDILATEPATVVSLWPESREDKPNRLYFGDNLHVLSLLLADPAVKGQIKLVYIDPPFATKSVFRSRSQVDAYHDLLQGAHYIEFLRKRLVLLRELLANEGSIYVHLDENMAFHIKVIMDEVFGEQNFRNWITRKKCHPKNYTKKTYGDTSDYILFYTKSDTYVWNRPYESWDAAHSLKEYQYTESGTGRRYKKVPVHAPGVRNGETGKPWRGLLPPPGKHWQFPPATLDEMDKRGEIYWSPTGNPRRKIYLDDSKGIPVQDIWLDFLDAYNQNVKITGYPTEKSPLLLERIIKASSNPGDMVLDCFSGSGTTLTVASELGRRWVGVDNSSEAIATTLRRFAKGTQKMGDYVSQRKMPPEELQLETLSLMPIRDFALYAAKPYAGELDGILAQWEKWVSH